MRIVNSERDPLIHATSDSIAEYRRCEQQRVDHLVLGQPRPPVAIPTKPKGLSKQEWKGQKQRIRDAGGNLPAGIEEWVALRERWSHKAQGTPETHEQASRPRPGSMARLWNSGAIDDDQLAAAEEIVAGYWAIAADVAVRTANLEARIDSGAHGKAEEERLGQILADLTYTSWRASLRGYGEPLLAVIVHDESLTVVARRHGLGMKKARRLLTEALDGWWVARAGQRRPARAMVAPDPLPKRAVPTMAVGQTITQTAETTPR